MSYFKIIMIYETIKELRPYFFSLREINNNVSLDIKFPTSWKYEEILIKYKMINPKIQDSNEKSILLSLISTATKEGYEEVMACAMDMISFNKEREEKEKLFQEKVSELQKLFKQKTAELQEMFLNEPLEKLKEIKIESDEQTDTETNGGTPKGDG